MSSLTSLYQYFVLLFYVGSYVSANYKRVCYFTNWAQYRDGAGKYFAKDLDPFLCTHVIYAFAKVSGNSIEPYEWNDINQWGKGGYEMARDLKIANPDLQLLLAIGGWNHGSEPFTAMVSTQSNIDQFANNTVIFLRANGFDGLDLDWEYPANRGSPPEDKKRFTSLIQTLRNTFDADVLKTGRSQLLLTAAVSAGKSTIDTAYEIDKISLYLDFINLMAYDFNGGTSQTGHNSPLYNSGPPNPDFNTDFAVNLWLKGGAPKHKLIVGLATYGRSYTLQSTTNTGLGAPASGPGTAGTFTRESGFLAYYEICSFIANNGWTEVWLDGQQVPYAYKGNQWVGYDNLRSIEVKTNYIIDKGLGGAMVWAVDLDDFHGNCNQGNNPLMNKIRSVLNGTSGPDITIPTRPPVVSTSMNTVSAVSANYKRVCYFTNWAQYRDGAGKYFAKDVDPFLCTHVIYAFAKVSGNSIEPYEWNDINEWGKGGYEMARDLKKANPDLRLLLAIGGWNHGSEPFTAMVSTQSNIDQFATNTVIFLRANGFDGLDLDWEYPANRGSPPEDKKRFTSLIQTLRNTFDADVLKTGRSQLLLTAAVSAGKSTIDTAYEIDKISLYLDFINLMAYDFNGGTSQTGHNSPLYNSGPPNPDFNTDFAVNLWLKGGAPRHKLIVGLATYGRSYTLSTTNTGLGAPVSGPGTAGTFTRESGFLAYYEICSFIANNGWTEVWLDGQQVPYAYKGNQWVGYDNLRSIEVKTNYIIDKGLGGAMIWAVDLDDFHGNCNQGNNPLMNKIRTVLNGASGPDIPLTSRPSVVSTSMNAVSAGLQKDCGCSVNTVGVGLGVSLAIVIATNVALVFYILSLKGCKLLPACANKNIRKLNFHIGNQVIYTDMIKSKQTHSESSVTGEFTSSATLCIDNLTCCLENEEQVQSIQINSTCDATNPSNENSEYDIVIRPFQPLEPVVQKDLKLSSSTVA